MELWATLLVLLALPLEQSVTGSETSVSLPSDLALCGDTSSWNHVAAALFEDAASQPSQALATLMDGRMFAAVRDSQGLRMTKGGVSAKIDDMTALHSIYSRYIEQLTGYSIIVKPEAAPAGACMTDADVRAACWDAAAAALKMRFQVPVTQHWYLSGREAHALRPHTDGGDVFVMQVDGEKHWQICLPPASATSRRECAASDTCTDADVVIVEEMKRKSSKGMWLCLLCLLCLWA